jgi:hypothetical protein
MTINSQTIFFCLLLTLIFEACIFSGDPIGQQNYDNASKANDMKKADDIILHGILNIKMTVGYRSPYILVTEDAKEFEIRGSELVDRDQLDKYIGQKVELRGKQVTIPSQKAPPGSEAESRFVDGVIPKLEYVETISVRRL